MAKLWTVSIHVWEACDFGNPDKEIGEIILSCQSNFPRRKALRKDLDLAGLIKTGRALELSERQAKEFESLQKTVNAGDLNEGHIQYQSPTKA